MNNRTWRSVARQSLELPARAQGLASTDSLPSDLHQTVKLPDMRELGLLGLVQSRSEEVVMLELDSSLVAHEGRTSPARDLDPAMGAKDVVLDGRKGRAWVQWEHAGQMVRLLLDAGAVSLEVSPSLGDWPPVELPEVPVADVEAQLTMYPAPQWLVAEARETAMGTVVQRAGALALLARYLTVPLEHSLEGRGPWVDAISTWRRLDVPLRTAVLEHARFVADGLEAELDDLEQLAAQKLGLASFREWLMRRDDLESLGMLVDKAGGGEALREALQALDRSAIEARAMFDSVAGQLHLERLSELSWMDPAAWWGQLE